jgi:predicted membrane-bound spermidine synthase
VYFLLIGVGFMMTEVVLLQRLSLVLGDPDYSLIVVLASLVASMGLGSLLSDRLPVAQAPLCFVYPLLIAAAIGATTAIWPTLSRFAIAAEPPIRIAIAIGLTMTLGVLLGVAFPAGMRFAQSENREETPWFWGMNGVGSVVAGSMTVILAQRWGLTVAMSLAACAYILLLIPIFLWRRHSSS